MEEARSRPADAAKATEGRSTWLNSVKEQLLAMSAEKLPPSILASSEVAPKGRTQSEEQLLWEPTVGRFSETLGRMDSLGLTSVRLVELGQHVAHGWVHLGGLLLPSPVAGEVRSGASFGLGPDIVGPRLEI